MNVIIQINGEDVAISLRDAKILRNELNKALHDAKC